MINTCCNLYFYYNFIVHGGIRHLEKSEPFEQSFLKVHGGIRHLEIGQPFKTEIDLCSWRHTPFRK